jgi:hypothetical protein
MKALPRTPLAGGRGDGRRVAGAGCRNWALASLLRNAPAVLLCGVPCRSEAAALAMGRAEWRDG